MPLNLSPYADAESGAPAWRTGEREAAIVFLSLTVYIILDVNVGIYRVFRRKRGLYYWSLILATWGTLVVAVGNIFKNLKPEWGVIWPLWTLMINGGWSVYAPAECMVLYSRLHLVNQNERLHRWLLMMIVIGSVLIIIPNWVFVFGAYDVNPKVSSIWSPRMAIIDRVSQAGFTLFEFILSSVYISSLLEILRTKISMRTRRVMRDLIVMNVTVILMDLLVIIMIFLDQANLAYPLQDFTYAFKFKIEFAVLNQLMAVAASGSRHGSRKHPTFEEGRYRRPGKTVMLTGYSDDDLSGVRLPFLSLSTGSEQSPQSTVQGVEKNSDMFDRLDVSPITTVTKPVAALSKAPGDAGANISKGLKKGPDQSLTLGTPETHVPNQHGSRDVEDAPKHEDLMRSARGSNSYDVTREPMNKNVDGLQRPPTQPSQAQRNSLRSIIFRRHEKKVDPQNTDVLASGHHVSDVNTSTPTSVPGAVTAPLSNPNPEWDKFFPETSTATRRSRWKMGGRNNEERKRENDESDGDDCEDRNEGVHAWERQGKEALDPPWFPR